MVTSPAICSLIVEALTHEIVKVTLVAIGFELCFIESVFDAKFEDDRKLCEVCQLLMILGGGYLMRMNIFIDDKGQLNYKDNDES